MIFLFKINLILFTNTPTYSFMKKMNLYAKVTHEMTISKSNHFSGLHSLNFLVKYNFFNQYRKLILYCLFIFTYPNIWRKKIFSSFLLIFIHSNNIFSIIFFVLIYFFYFFSHYFACNLEKANVVSTCFYL